jgi:hypothetical protein
MTNFIIIQIYKPIKKIKNMKKRKGELLSNTNNVKNSKFIANNTLRINYNDGSSSIRLHNTDVVTFQVNGNIVLNSGNWRTPTTKERINRFSPTRISQNKGLWYLRDGNLFYDNCIINSAGNLISKPVNNTKFENQAKKLKKQINDYCNLITKDNIPVPSSGDCWLCMFMDPAGKDNSHLLSHIKEKYLHGSIIVNAMKETGYSDIGISLHFHSKNINTLKRSVRKYLQKRLISGIAVK